MKNIKNLNKIKSMPEGQYRYDLFEKLGFDFKPGSTILDVGCGSAYNSVIFRDIYDLKVSSTDIYQHVNIDKYKLNFKLSSILDLPYKDNSFDYVFIQDVLHHIDELKQRKKYHISALRELQRITVNNGHIIIVEANRFNPLFYPHMVKLLKHEHFTQKYLINIVKEVFPDVNFQFVEIHYYDKAIKSWKIYEHIMEKYAPNKFKAYNIGIIKNDKEQ